MLRAQINTACDNSRGCEETLPLHRWRTVTSPVPQPPTLMVPDCYIFYPIPVHALPRHSRRGSLFGGRRAGGSLSSLVTADTAASSKEKLS
jgi:hypothetical protein